MRRLAPRVTSLDYNHRFAAHLAARNMSANGSVLQGDASVLPFAERKFSSVIAILMLHHLRSSEQQEEKRLVAQAAARAQGRRWASG